jgi:hypothetical protein
VPMTKGMSRYTTTPTFETFAFDYGGIHAYGFNGDWYGKSEPGCRGQFYNEPPIYYRPISTYSTGPDTSNMNHVYYKYFPNASFQITRSSYVWFFTRTPLFYGEAYLNNYLDRLP